MLLLQNHARLSTDRLHINSGDAPVSLGDLSASIVRVDSPDAFDDCDVALNPAASICRVCTPVMREPSPMLREPSPMLRAPTPVATAPAILPNAPANRLMGEDMQTVVPTPLDGGITLVSLTVSMGVACCVMDELRAIPAAGAFVMAASLAAAHMHGTQTPYTHRYGASTPAGVVTMAAAYLACGIVVVGVRSFS